MVWWVWCIIGFLAVLGGLMVVFLITMLRAARDADIAEEDAFKAYMEQMNHEKED